MKKALRKLRHDWHDLDTMIQAELRRKKPRYEKDELQMREEVVLKADAGDRRGSYNVEAGS